MTGDTSLERGVRSGAGAPESNRERISRRLVDKFAERRAELAGAALQALGELGYARTSLREIAQNSRFSYGVLHYYFADKLELILYCVKEYKALCVKRFDQMVVDAESADSLANVFALGLAQTAREPRFQAVGVASTMHGSTCSTSLARLARAVSDPARWLNSACWNSPSMRA